MYRLPERVRAELIDHVSSIEEAPLIYIYKMLLKRGNNQDVLELMCKYVSYWEDCVRKIIKKRLSNLVASSDAICASNKVITQHQHKNQALQEL